MPNDQFRSVLLEVVAEFASERDSSLQSKSVLDKTSRRLGIRNDTEKEQALLTVWSDLFRQGMLAWGYNLLNSDPPFFHLTEPGRKTLEHLSRDPSNPDGYLAHLRFQATLNPVSESYIQEAIHTYNAGCFKAAAVMVGVAAESAVLELRDVVIERLKRNGQTVSKNLTGWQVKRVLDAIQAVLQKETGSMTGELRERFGAYWPAFVQHIRSTRNEAGHPTSIDPVSPEKTHASLLVFPEMARLARDLIDWAGS